MATSEELRAAGETIIAVIKRSLPRWTCWFPSDESAVEIQRKELLSLVHWAEIALREHPADDGEAVDVEWMRKIHARTICNGNYILDGFHGGFYLKFVIDEEGAGLIVCRTPSPGEDDAEIWLSSNLKSRGDVRRLCAALGIQLKESTT